MSVAWRVCSALALALIYCSLSDAGVSVEAPLTVVLDGSGTGQTFDGIGASSGGGASSRLLYNYSEPQRSEILDYLFKPRFGAALQSLKVEIGGDGNSGMGAEPSHRRRDDDDAFSRGYEWWLMHEARSRNPTIPLLALAWNFPAWVSQANSVATVDYLVDYLRGAKQAQNLDIDYIGLWNETPMDPQFIKQLRRALDAAHLTTRIVADDLVNDWSIVDKMAADPELRAAVDVIATHYPRTLSPPTVRAQARGWGKPLWSSEDGPWDDAWGARGLQSTPLAELLNRNYIQAGITSTNLWNMVTSYYDILDYTNAGLMRAKTPWSGHYEVTSPVWVVAHTTQFAAPGWRYIDTSSALLPGGGSYVTLHKGRAYSIVVETIAAEQAQVVEFRVQGGLSTGALHVWHSNALRFLQEERVVSPVGGRYTLIFEPGSVYTVTTTTGQHAGASRPPAERPFPLPYGDDFEKYALGTDSVDFFAEQNGSFVVAPCTDGRTGQCLDQVVNAPPVWWTYGADAARLGTPSVIGDAHWRDYRVAADVRVNGEGYAGLLGRVSRVLCCDGTLAGYQLRLHDTGQWELLAQSRDAVLASGVASASATPWRHLEMSFDGDHIQASVDGALLVQIDDSQNSAGLAGILGGWNWASYDNFRIEPITPGRPVIVEPPRRVAATAPEQPKLLVPVIKRNAVELMWTAVPEATRYRIVFGTNGDAPRSIELGNATRYTVTTLTNGARYRFQVLAINEQGAGELSEAQDATPGEWP